MTENQSDVYQISLNYEQFLVEVTFIIGNALYAIHRPSLHFFLHLSFPISLPSS